MTSPTLASFTATDGTGLWEVTSAGIRVNGELYRFTDRSFVVAVLQETGSLTDATLARWALGGSSVRIETDKREICGNAQLTIGGLQRPRKRDCSLRYREDGRWIQADEIRAFGDAAHKAINAYRERWGGV